jgi:hypothetical protein
MIDKGTDNLRRVFGRVGDDVEHSGGQTGFMLEKTEMK